MAFQMPTFVSRLLRPFTTGASLSLQPDALSAMPLPAGSQRATFAAGCFWGVEKDFRRHFEKGKGLVDCRVGYTGGDDSHGRPSYRAVCSGRTGHAEALLVVFDPDIVTYRQLVEFFFRMHDPTTMNRQGPDTGSQYRSAIFAHDDSQLKIATEIKEKAQKQWFKGKTLATEIALAGKWYDAEDYHQEYLDQPENTFGYQCPTHFVRNFPPLE